MEINMKKYFVKLACLCFATLMIIPCFSACQKKADYRDDVKVADMSSALKDKLPVADGYYAADSDYLGFYFEGAADIVAEYVIEFSATSTNINQFGIFHVKDGTAEQMKTLCDSYIQKMRDRWVAQANYIASEHPKMENAEARVFGNYVVFVMLTAEDKATAFATVEELLKK